MNAGINPVPAGYEGATPHLICKNAEAAIDFYTRAFDAVEMFRLGEAGKVGHAEMKIADRVIIMLADEHPETGMLSPQTIGGTPISLLVYVDDVDSFCEKAVAEGLEVLKPVEDQFYGDRLGRFKDPFGHIWGFATHTRDVSPEEMSGPSE
ncbi:MAG: VOC family protein [Pyrinomonadaceae bacterium]